MPSPSIREQVLLGIKAALAEINGQAPYQTAVDDVLDDDLAADDEISGDVLLGVFERSYRTDANQYRLVAAAQCPTTLMVGVRALVRGGTDDAPGTKDKLANDVHRAIFKDPSFGIRSNALTTTSLSIENVIVGKLGTGCFASFLATITIFWLADPTNP